MQDVNLPEPLQSMGNPHCAAVKTNNSAHASSINNFWSLKGSCVKDGTVFTHFNAKKSNLVADSCNNSRDENGSNGGVFDCFGIRSLGGELFLGSSVLVTSTISSSLENFD